MIPSNFQLQYSEEQIAHAVSKMGGSITQWALQVWERSHTDIITIPVLRGGIFFFADLVRKIDHSVEISPVRTWGYSTSETGKPSDSFTMNIDGVPAEGRSILLVDDICDSGRTLSSLKEAFLEAGAREVRAAVLIRRILDHETFQPDWVGFSFNGPEWFVGYGMEDCERYRNLPATYLIKQA